MSYRTPGFHLRHRVSKYPDVSSSWHSPPVDRVTSEDQSERRAAGTERKGNRHWGSTEGVPMLQWPGSKQRPGQKRFLHLLTWFYFLRRSWSLSEEKTLHCLLLIILPHSLCETWNHPEHVCHFFSCLWMSFSESKPKHQPLVVLTTFDV